MEFCSHFEQIAYPPNFLRELALKFCFRQKSLKLRHSSNWAANLFKIWQNSNAAFSVAYLFFIIYLKSIEWTIHKIENLSGCVWRTALVVKKEIFRQKVMLLCFINIPTNQRFVKKAFKNAECHPFFLINISSYLLSDPYMQHYLQITIV